MKQRTGGYKPRTSLGSSMPWYEALYAVLFRIITYITYQTSILSTALELILELTLELVSDQCSTTWHKTVLRI